MRSIDINDKYNNHSLYYTLCSTLMNAFSSNTYAFMILEGYISMALIKYYIGLFDSHSRNVCSTLVHA
jgi:serine/threonine protein kinase HipA of HipAB toxin-antitoxin module